MKHHVLWKFFPAWLNKCLLDYDLKSFYVCHSSMCTCHWWMNSVQSAEDGSMSSEGTALLQPLVVSPAGIQSFWLLFYLWADVMASVPRPESWPLHRDSTCTGADWWPWWCLFFLSSVSQGLQISQGPSGAFVWTVPSGKDGPHVRVCGDSRGMRWWKQKCCHSPAGLVSMLRICFRRVSSCVELFFFINIWFSDAVKNTSISISSSSGGVRQWSFLNFEELPQSAFDCKVKTLQ